MFICIVQSTDIHNECVNTEKQRIHQKEDKELHVPITNTIVNPWTMMVHTDNTPIAGATMMSSRRFVGIALGTK